MSGMRRLQRGWNGMLEGMGLSMPYIGGTRTKCFCFIYVQLSNLQRCWNTLKTVGSDHHFRQVTCRVFKIRFLVQLHCFQSCVAFYTPLLRQDMTNLKNGLLTMLSVCQSADGVKVCRCSTNDTWTISDPRASITATFFCLPDRCECNDGTHQNIDLWVSFVCAVVR